MAFIDLTGTSSPIPPGLEIPLPTPKPSILSPEEKKEDICSTNNPSSSVGRSMGGVGWAARSQRSARFINIGQGPSRLPETRTPTTELEIIKRRKHAGPGFYHTLLKPGCNTVKFKGVTNVPTPDIFKGLKLSPSRDIAVGDIDYSNKRAVRPYLNTPGPGTFLEDSFADDEIETMPTPVQVVSDALVSSKDSKMNEADISDVDASLDPEPGTPPNPDHLESTDTESINTSPEVLSEPYMEPRRLSEPALWDIDHCSSGTGSEGILFSPRNDIYQHDLYERLRKELLDLREQAMGFKKDMQKLESRVQFLETKRNKKKPKELRKNRKLLLRAEDAHIVHVIQHVNHLIELRDFMEKLKKKKKKTRLEKTKGGIRRNPPRGTGFKYVIKPKHVS